MLAAGLEDATDSCDERGLEHRVVEAAGLIAGAQVCGGEVVDRHGWHVVCDVLEVFAHGVVGVLDGDDVHSVGGELLGDLDAILSELQVEVLDVLDGLLVELNGLGEGVPAQAIGHLLPQQLEQLVGFELEELSLRRGDGGIRLRGLALGRGWGRP